MTSMLSLWPTGCNYDLQAVTMTPRLSLWPQDATMTPRLSLWPPGCHYNPQAVTMTPRLSLWPPGCHYGPGAENSPSQFLYYWSLIDKSGTIIIYEYVLRVTNLAAMASIYMVNFVNKLPKKWSKRTFLLPFLQYWSQIDKFGMYVSIYNSSLPFYLIFG